MGKEQGTVDIVPFLCTLTENRVRAKVATNAPDTNGHSAPITQAWWSPSEDSIAGLRQQVQRYFTELRGYAVPIVWAPGLRVINSESAWLTRNVPSWFKFPSIASFCNTCFRIASLNSSSVMLPSSSHSWLTILPSTTTRYSIREHTHTQAHTHTHKHTHTTVTHTHSHAHKQHVSMNPENGMKDNSNVIVPNSYHWQSDGWM